MSAPLPDVRPAARRGLPAGLRVAALIPSGDISGPGRQLAALATALQERGADVLVVQLHRHGKPDPGYSDYLTAAGVEFRVLADRNALDPSLVGGVGRLLADWQPTVLQTHGYKSTAVAWAMRRLGRRWPWLGFFHGETTEDAKARLYHRLEKRLLRAADQVVVMSRRQAAGFGPAPNVTLVHNAVLDLPESDDVAERARVLEACAALPAPLVGVVARLSPEKGVDLFLEAAAREAAAGRPFSAIIAGSGPEADRLERQCADLGLAGRVRFLGHSPAVEALYPRLDLLVLPSRSEGLPNALLEALRADVPVVATDVGAIREVVGDSPAAVVVPPESVEALADGMAVALRHGRDDAAAAARRDAVERFSLERRVDRIVTLYDRLHRGLPPLAGASP